MLPPRSRREEREEQAGPERLLGLGEQPPPSCCLVLGAVAPLLSLPVLTALSSPPQERFVDLYGNDAAAEVRKGQETFNKWLLTGATVAGVLLLGSLLSRK